MQVIVDIPDTLAAEIGTHAPDMGRSVLEAVAVEGYRAGRLYEGDIRLLMGYETPMEVHELLARYNVPLNYSAEDFTQDMETLRRVVKSQPPVAA